MIGARNMESAILGGYVDHVMQLHPTAPLPGVYLADDIFKNAQQHRQGDGKSCCNLTSSCSQVLPRVSPSLLWKPWRWRFLVSAPS